VEDGLAVRSRNCSDRLLCHCRQDEGPELVMMMIFWSSADKWHAPPVLTGDGPVAYAI